MADNVPDADAETDFFKMELFIELKLAETSDPFRDRKDPLRPQAENFRFENDSDISGLNRGRLCSYTGSQFCVHTFTLSICGRSARFIHWNRMYILQIILVTMFLIGLVHCDTGLLIIQGNMMVPAFR